MIDDKKHQYTKNLKLNAETNF